MQLRFCWRVHSRDSVTHLLLLALGVAYRLRSSSIFVDIINGLLTLIVSIARDLLRQLWLRVLLGHNWWRLHDLLRLRLAGFSPQHSLLLMLVLSILIEAKLRERLLLHLVLGVTLLETNISLILLHRVLQLIGKRLLLLTSNRLALLWRQPKLTVRRCTRKDYIGMHLLVLTSWHVSVAGTCHVVSGVILLSLVRLLITHTLDGVFADTDVTLLLHWQLLLLLRDEVARIGMIRSLTGLLKLILILIWILTGEEEDRLTWGRDCVWLQLALVMLLGVSVVVVAARSLLLGWSIWAITTTNAFGVGLI